MSRRTGPSARFGLRQALRVFGPFARPHLPVLILSLVLVLGSTAFRLAKPWPLAFLVDEVLGKPRSDASFELLVIVVVAAVVGLAVLEAAVNFVRSYLMQTVARRWPSGSGSPSTSTSNGSRSPSTTGPGPGSS
jgi:ABC-type bacteriocin/lantibiotic exporters, contain an N-terminal double-glycine peptidase domain